MSLWRNFWYSHRTVEQVKFIKLIQKIFFIWIFIMILCGTGYKIWIDNEMRQIEKELEADGIIIDWNPH